MNIKLQIKNYKLIKDLDLELQDSNVYLISGQNEVGKSSLLEALKTLIKAKNETDIPVSQGKEECSIVGIIETPDGITYSVTMDATKDGKIKFTMVNEKGLRTNAVTSIRDVFAYQDFTAEEFVSWGKTAEGRKKQADIFLKCLDDQARKLYTELSEKEKIEYDKRTPVISGITHYSKRLEEIQITEKQKNLMNDDLDAVQEEIQFVKKKYDDAKLLNEKASSIDLQLEEVENAYADTQKRIDQEVISIEEQIKALELKKTTLLSDKTNYTERYENKKKELNNQKTTFASVDMTELLDHYTQACTMEDMIASAKHVFEDYSNAQTKLKECEDKKKILDKDIDSLRDQKKLLIKNNPILKDIQVEDDGIYVLNDEQMLPLSDTQISQSRQMLIACKILLKLNPQLPILLVGRGESFDKKRLEELHVMAGESKAIILVEKVIEEGGLKVEALIEQ